MESEIPCHNLKIAYLAGSLSRPFKKVKLTFIANPSNNSALIEEFKVAKLTPTELVAVVAISGTPTVGGFTEKGIKICHAIFTVSDLHPGGCYSC